MEQLNQINQGDALEVLKTFPDGFVDCCVTSRRIGDCGTMGQKDN
jgi:DNA modification methylase